MEARAGFRNAYLPTGRPGLFLIAVLAAFLLGAGGGYLAGGLSSSPTTVVNNAPSQRPFVVEPAPYSNALPSPASEPTRDPKGFAVPI